MVELAPQNGCHKYLCHQGEFQLPAASLDGSQKDPGPFQMTASTLSQRVCEILCVLFKSGVSIYYSSLAFLKIRPTGLQAKCSGGSPSCFWTPELGTPR